MKDRFPVRNVLITLIGDTIIYLLIAVYLDAVIPGKYGEAKHPLFIFTLSYWKRLTRQRSPLNSPQRRQEDHAGDIDEVSDEMMGNKVIR